MKMGVLLGMMALCVASTFAGECLTERVKIPPDTGSFVAPRPAVDYVAREAALLTEMKKIVAGRPFKEAAKDSKFTARAVAWYVIHLTGAEALNALAARDAKYACFLKLFLSDTEWMTLYLGAGLVPKDTDTGIRVLADIWAKDRHAPDAEKYRNLATGIAAAFGAGNFAARLRYGESLPVGNGRTDPVWRYFFFKSSDKRGVLYPGFTALRPWEIRYVAGNEWDDASIIWAQLNMNVAPQMLGDACWAAPYSGLSTFGDTIQGPLYYSFCPPEMGEAERTVVYGGVCGALSHVGSTATLARGIPTYTCGQPGHCAYAFRLKRGAWQGGFGGPDGGPHNFIFEGEAPTSVRLMEAAFADDKKVDFAATLMARAHACEAMGDHAMAKRLWTNVLRVAPFNYIAHQAFQAFALRTNTMTAAQWRAYAKMVVDTYATHGFAAAKVIKPAEEQFLSTMTAGEKAAWFMQIQALIAATPPSWATKKTAAATLNHQVSQIGGDDVAETRFLTELMEAHLKSGNENTFGEVLEWAIERYVSAGRDRIFAQAFSKAAGASETMDEEAKKKMRGIYTKAIQAAEKAKSRLAFLVLSKKAKDLGFDDGYEPERKLTLPAGKLVSAEGLLTLSSSSPWDRPCAHYKVLRDADGAFHTDNDENAFAIVELAKTVPVTSILIVKNRGNEGRSKHLIVSTSTDGATWFPLQDNENTPREWLITCNPPVQARWIKVEQIAGRKEVMHLRNILIFSK